MRDGAAPWTVRTIEDAEVARVAALAKDGLTVRDIATELGMSKSRVQRLKEKGVAEGKIVELPKRGRRPRPDLGTTMMSELKALATRVLRDIERDKVGTERPGNVPLPQSPWDISVPPESGHSQALSARTRNVPLSQPPMRGTMGHFLYSRDTRRDRSGTVPPPSAAVTAASRRAGPARSRSCSATARPYTITAMSARK